MNVIKYPRIHRIAQLYPSPEILLTRHIVWEEKRDGANVRFYLDDNDELVCGTRNMEVANADVRYAIRQTGHWENIRNFLLAEKHKSDRSCILFGELLQKGKSPTKIEYHEENELVFFDCYNLNLNEWQDLSFIEKRALEYNLPIVRVFLESCHSKIDRVYDARDKLLKFCKEKSIEGVVGKVYGNPTIFFKEKWDFRSVLDSEEPKIKKDKLPNLPFSEIAGAIEKAYVDLGLEKFNNVKIAMPLCARYVAEEAMKHGCAKPKNIFAFYQERVKEKNEVQKCSSRD